MAKETSFTSLNLRQSDYEGATHVETTSFYIREDGYWYEFYNTEGPGVDYDDISGSGYVTNKELQTLSSLFSKFEKKYTGVNHLDHGIIENNDDWFQSFATNSEGYTYPVLQDTAWDTAYVGGDYKAASALTDYMVSLATKYGHGLII